MTEVRIRQDEPVERALKRFKSVCDKAGILSEVRRRAYFDKPSVKKKKKAERAIKRLRKRMRRNRRNYH